MNLKHILLITSILVVFQTQAQNFPIDKGTGKITYMKTVTTEGMSASDIYSTVKDWAKDQDLTVTTDEANKKLVFKGKFDVAYRPAKGNTTEKGEVSYELHVGAKEGKYRYILVDLMHKGASGDGGKLENAKPKCGTNVITNNAWSSIKVKTHGLANKLIASLSKKIKEVQNDPTKSDDW